MPVDFATEFEAPKAVDFASEYKAPEEAKGEARTALLNAGLSALENPVERFIAKALLTRGGRAGDVALGVGVPLAGAVGGGAAGGPIGAAAGGGTASAASDTLNQFRQFFRGERNSISPGEAAASGVVGAFIPGEVAPAKTALQTVAKTVAVRSAQGTGLGAAQEGLKELFTGESLDFGKIASGAAFGTVFGGGFGALESTAPIAFRFLKGLGKKTPEEAAKAITPEVIANAPSDADKAALLEVRDQLDKASAKISVTEPTVATNEELLARRKSLEDALLGPPLETAPKSARDSAALLEHADDLYAVRNDIRERRAAQDLRQSPEGANLLAGDLQAQELANPPIVETPPVLPVEKSAAESAQAINEGLAARAEAASAQLRAEGFARARADELASQIGNNRIASPETTVLSNDALRNQISAIETRPGQSARERARLEAKIAEQTPQVDVEPTAELSPQAQKMYDEFGYVKPHVLTSLAGGATGAVAGSTQGDTPQERLKNAVLYGLVGVAGGAALGEILTRQMAGKSFIEQQAILEREAAQNADPLIRSKLSDLVENTRPLPDTAKITVMEMGGKRHVQVDIPGAQGERPVFSGSVEQARAAGFGTETAIENLPHGTYTYGELSNNENQLRSATALQGEGQEAGSVSAQHQSLPSTGKEERGPLWSTRQLQEALGPLPAPVRTLSSTAGGVNPILARALTSGAGGLGGFAYGYEQHPDEPVERRLVNGLNVALIGAGGGYALGSAFTRLAANAKPSTASPELAKWYERLNGLPQTESLWEKLKGAPNRFRTLFTTSFAPLDRIPGLIAEANGVPAPTTNLPLSKSFELIYGASGKAAVDVEDFASSVLSQLRSGEERDFNALLAIKRTGQRLQADANLQAEQARIAAIPQQQWSPDEAATMQLRPDRRRVGGETLQSVDLALQALEAKLGTPRFNELDQLAGGAFQQEADKALQRQVAAGRMSQEVYDGIKASNDFYAPFRVLEAAEEFDGFRSIQATPVDTTRKYTQAITGIDSLDFHLGNPLEVMQDKIFQSRVLAEKNLKMQELARLADEDPSGTVLKKLAPNTDAPRGMIAVNYFENGVPQRLAVSQEVAEAVKGLNRAESGVIARFARAVNRPFRFGATGGNIAFQAVNAPADQYRLATTSKYGLGAGSMVDTLRYPVDFVQSLYAAMLGPRGASTAAGAVGGFYAGYSQGDDTLDKFKKGAAGAVAGAALGAGAKKLLPESELYRQFYESGAAGATMQDMINRLSGQRTLTQEAANVSGRGVLNTLEDFGKAVEETTKILGFKRGLRIEGINPTAASADKLAQVVSEVRNFAGSPDFAVAGTVARDLNAALVFLNPRIQGMSEDFGRLAGRDGAKMAASTWLKLGGATGAAAAYLWYRNHAAENAADYSQVSPEEKNRYAMIPRYDEQGQPLYFTNDRGQRVRDYYRIPLRDTMQDVYGLVSAAVDFANNKNPDAVKQFGSDLLENVSPVNISGRNTQERVESAVANLGPLGTVPYMLASNRNPSLHQDIYKGVVSEEVMQQASPTNRFNPATPEVYKQIANLMPQWMADPLRSPVMLQQLAQSVSGGILNQFTPPKPSQDRDPTATALQQSPLGRRFVRSTYVYDPPREEAQQALTVQADQKVTQARDVKQLFDELDALPQADRAQRFQSLEPDQQKALAQEFKRRQERPADTEIAMIHRMEVGNGVRAQYIFGRLGQMEPEARATFFKQLQDNKALSPQVVKQLEYLYNRSQSAGRN